MRLVFVSDTHNRLGRVKVPDGDMLIHCGDFTMRVEAKTPSEHLSQVANFNRELGELPHRFKVVVAGNHETVFEQMNAEARALLTNAVYLQDELVELAGLRIYGSPWQPEYRKWAFNLPRSSPELAAVWQKVPDHVDVLVTHGPPKGILDRAPLWPTLGDEFLLERVLQVRPKVHCFGHVHHSAGVTEQNGTTFVNAACLTEKYQPTENVIVLDI
ncbi:metallophosphatase domain-containing protein [Candidatus Obscuribacterales bacterium]|nr:metallophosphatase domain-containing protein [Candidatus Obscuribacterales bacterium]